MELKEVLGEELFNQVDTVIKDAKGKNGKELRLIIANDGDYVPKEKYNTLKSDNKSLIEKLSKVETIEMQIRDIAQKFEITSESKEDEKVDVTKLINEISAKVNDFDKVVTDAIKENDIKHENQRKLDIIRNNLEKENPNDVDLVFSQLELEKINIENNKLNGYEEQINLLKEEKKFLFKTPEIKGDDLIDGAVSQKNNDPFIQGFMRKGY